MVNIIINRRRCAQRGHGPRAQGTELAHCARPHGQRLLQQKTFIGQQLEHINLASVASIKRLLCKGVGCFSDARSSARPSWHVSRARFICKHVLSLATIILLNDNDNDGALVLLARIQPGVVHLPRWPPVPAQRVRRQRQPRAAVAVAVAGAGAAACQAPCAAAGAACTLPPSTIVRAFFQIQNGGSSLFLQRAATASAAENYFVSQRHLQYSLYYVCHIDYI